MKVTKTLVNTIRWMSVRMEPHVVYLETLSHMIKGEERENVEYSPYWRVFLHDHMMYLSRPDVARLWIHMGCPNDLTEVPASIYHGLISVCVNKAAYGTKTARKLARHMIEQGDAIKVLSQGDRISSGDKMYVSRNGTRFLITDENFKSTVMMHWSDGGWECNDLRLKGYRPVGMSGYNWIDMEDPFHSVYDIPGFYVLIKDQDQMDHLYHKPVTDFK